MADKYGGIVRIERAAYEELQRVSKMTRTPIADIATRAIEYALRNSRLVQANVYDIVFGDCGKEG